MKWATKFAIVVSNGPRFVHFGERDKAIGELGRLFVKLQAVRIFKNERNRTYIFKVTPLICSHPCRLEDRFTTDIHVVHDSEEDKIFVRRNPKPPGGLAIFGRVEQPVEVNSDWM